MESFLYKTVFTIDKFLQVKCCHHGILVNLSINSISDVRQICTLIDDLFYYSEYDTVDIGKIYIIFFVQFRLLLTLSNLLSI